MSANTALRRSKKPGRRTALTAAVGTAALAAATALATPPAEANVECYYCHPKCVTTDDMNYYVNSTSSQRRYIVYGRHQVFVAQEANGRYHASIYDSSGTLNGWFTTDPRWHYNGYC